MSVGDQDGRSTSAEVFRDDADRSSKNGATHFFFGDADEPSDQELKEMWDWADARISRMGRQFTEVFEFRLSEGRIPK